MTELASTNDSLPRELEPAFGDYFLRQAAPRARIGMVVATLVFALATLGDLKTMPAEVLAWSVPLRVGLVCPFLLFLGWVVSDPSRFRWHTPAAFAACIVSGAVISAIVVHLQALGYGWTIQRAVLLTFGMYVLSGLRPRFALGLGLFMMVSIGSMQLYIGHADARTLRGLISLLGANLLGASAAFQIERSARLSFTSRLRLVEMAERDGLTGLYNRRHLDDHLARVHRQAQRDKANLAVAMIDVDDFKSFNDAQGHQAGDACLRDVAAALESPGQRPLDLVARYGGEEFCVVWYGAEPDAVLGLVERCRRAVAALGIAHPDSRAAAHVSVSCGVAVAAAKDRSIEDLLAASDAALYRAKEQGRNRSVVASVDAEERGARGRSPELLASSADAMCPGGG